MPRILLGLFLLIQVTLSHAWWNEDWTVRKKITLDTSASGVSTQAALEGVPVLVRLHSGNFDFLSVREDGADLRFVADDDKTPLKYHIEKFDPVNELALVWVKVPKLEAGNKQQYVWLYSGNEKAAAAQDAAGSYDAQQIAVWHFAEAAGAPQDSTGFGNHASAHAGARVAAAAIGAGLGFDGRQTLTVAASPSLKLTPAGGFTISAWVKPTGAGQDAVLFRQQEGGKSISVGLRGGRLYASVTDAGPEARTPPVDLDIGAWSHVAVTLADRLRVYVNGNLVGEAAAVVPDMGGVITVGEGYTGELDELALSNVARSADWIRIAALGQGPEAKLTQFGEDESADSGGHGSYVGIILSNVTVDGWVVIVILAIMFAISVLVMVSKYLVVNKTEQANRQFLDAYHQLRRGEAEKLDVDDNPEDADIKDSALLTVLFGKHDHYQHSSLYRLYHAGIQELKHRFGGLDHGIITPQALGAIKATLDGALVRERQKLNDQMVLLTIAISGGPFLGLLGTVVGVMITFAAIAATGDVNVTAIAPGIAAALVATAAGVGVAIPALFGYNYLGSRVKAITADMQVFVDEFVAKMAEEYSGREA
jgi:biopolymer transport protein ExbB